MGSTGLLAARQLARTWQDRRQVVGRRRVVTATPSPAPTGHSTPPDWVARVAREAATEAQTPVDLLTDYLEVLSEAALSGTHPRPSQLSTIRRIGRDAAERGVAPGHAVDLYLSAAWRLWRALPAVESPRAGGDARAAAGAVRGVVGEAVEPGVAGSQSAGREMTRREEPARREFV